MHRRTSVRLRLQLTATAIPALPTEPGAAAATPGAAIVAAASPTPGPQLRGDRSWLMPDERGRPRDERARM